MNVRPDCLSGAVHPDHDANERLYGRPITPVEILGGQVRPPPQFEQLIAQLRDVDAAADAAAQDSVTDMDTAYTVGHPLCLPMCTPVRYGSEHARPDLAAFSAVML